MCPLYLFVIDQCTWALQISLPSVLVTCSCTAVAHQGWGWAAAPLPVTTNPVPTNMWVLPTHCVEPVGPGAGMTPFLGIHPPGGGSNGNVVACPVSDRTAGTAVQRVTPTMSPALLLGAGAQCCHVPFTRVVALLNSSLQTAGAYWGGNLCH